MTFCIAATGARSCNRRGTNISRLVKNGRAHSAIYRAKFITTMPETGNQNPHHTLFAGSLFSLATLTGWGLIWLMLRERHLGGTIILADAHIRYSKPISGKPHAVADLGALSGDLDVWRADEKHGCRCRSKSLATRRRVQCLKARISFCPRSHLARMKRAGTKKSS